MSFISNQGICKQGRNTLFLSNQGICKQGGDPLCQQGSDPLFKLGKHLLSKISRDAEQRAKKTKPIKNTTSLTFILFQVMKNKSK
jgi:hypothetical protein